VSSTILVVTTVHRPDDTRIRERLIRSLASEFRVVYACRSPGPSERDGLAYVELSGGRARRNWDAIRVILRSSWVVLVLHDPETIFAGLIARLIKRRPVVFDVHEDFPAAALTRSWVPTWLRRPLAWSARWMMALAEKTMHVTLAEPGYTRLFIRDHAVFPNYPDTSRYPEPVSEGDGCAVYLGDLTTERGVDVAVEASAKAAVRLRLIGPASDEIRTVLKKDAERGVVEFVGALPNPDALDNVALASVGLAPLRDTPNYRHSQPTKILEYLALGVPVVASDLPGTRSLTEGLDAVILVRPGDAGELADAIARAMRPEAREAAIAQTEAIRERFRWPGDEVRAYYRSLVAQ